MARGPRLEIAIGEKRFAGQVAAVFEKFTLSVAPGSVVAVLGPSGIGKSSLLRLVAGIDRDFEGAIAIDGVPAAQAPPPGLVFQDARLLPWLSALDNVCLAPDADRAQAMLALAQMGLGKEADLFPRQLSGGMQRRVALARAFAVNSGLLLLDEPFVSLDAALAADMRSLLARLIETAEPSVLLVSHQPEEAAQLADRGVMLAGRPARIVADVAFPLPRGRRDGAVLADYVRQLSGLVGSRP